MEQVFDQAIEVRRGRHDLADAKAGALAEPVGMLAGQLVGVPGDAPQGRLEIVRDRVCEVLEFLVARRQLGRARLYPLFEGVGVTPQILVEPAHMFFCLPSLRDVVDHPDELRAGPLRAKNGDDRDVPHLEPRRVLRHLFPMDRTPGPYRVAIPAEHERVCGLGDDVAHLRADHLALPKPGGLQEALIDGREAETAIGRHLDGEDDVGDVVQDQRNLSLALAHRVLDRLPLRDVADDRLDQHIGTQLEAVQTHLGGKRRAVCPAVQPLEELRSVLQGQVDLLEGLFLGRPPVWLHGRREPGRARTHDIFAAAAEHGERPGIAVDEAVVAHQEDGISRCLEQRPILELVLEQRQLHSLLPGDVDEGAEEAGGDAARVARQLGPRADPHNTAIGPEMAMDDVVGLDAANGQVEMLFDLALILRMNHAGQEFRRRDFTVRSKPRQLARSLRHEDFVRAQVPIDEADARQPLRLQESQAALLQRAFGAFLVADVANEFNGPATMTSAVEDAESGGLQVAPAASSDARAERLRLDHVAVPPHRLVECLRRGRARVEEVDECRTPQAEERLRVGLVALAEDSRAAYTGQRLARAVPDDDPSVAIDREGRVGQELDDVGEPLTGFRYAPRARRRCRGTRARVLGGVGA